MKVNMLLVRLTSSMLTLRELLMSGLSDP